MDIKQSIRFLSYVIGISIFIALVFTVVFAHPNAGTNIDTQTVGEKWGWNDILGWINLHDNHTIMVSGTGVVGHATSSWGNIVMNGITNGGESFGVAHNGIGGLSGWAWNDVAGWISISGVTNNGQSYGLRIEPSLDAVNSYFRGWAWNDIIGWINFNCADTNSCSGVGGNNYKTQTSVGSKAGSATLISNIIDIGTTTGIINTIMWKGVQPGLTKVQFQIATANTANAAWDSLYGPVIEISNNMPYLLNIQNQRYLRYKVTLVSDTWQTATPRIDDILINWSP